MTDVFKALADPTRREILDLLRINGDLRAGDIAAEFPSVTRIAISKHLKILNEASMVQIVSADDARARVYTLQAGGMEEVKTWIEAYDTFWKGKLKDLKSIVEDKKNVSGDT